MEGSSRLDRDWLDEGAIHLLLPDRLLGKWRGIHDGDYQRAGATSSDWLNQLRVGDGLGLVMGGDPGMALVVPGRPDAVAIVRWLYGDDEDRLIAFALAEGMGGRTEPEFVFENADAAWSLFDAAADPSRGACRWRRVMLPVGRLRVQTVYRASEREGAIVHLFGRAV